jgi:hypothetical protein
MARSTRAFPNVAAERRRNARIAVPAVSLEALPSTHVFSVARPQKTAPIAPAVFLSTFLAELISKRSMHVQPIARILRIDAMYGTLAVAKPKQLARPFQ